MASLHGPAKRHTGPHPTTHKGWRERRGRDTDGGSAVPKPLVPDIIYPQWNMDIRGWDNTFTTTTTLSQRWPNFVPCCTVHYICDVGSSLKRHPHPPSKTSHSFYFRLIFKLVRCWVCKDTRLRWSDVLVGLRWQESHFVGDVQKVAFSRLKSHCVTADYVMKDLGPQQTHKANE